MAVLVVRHADAGNRGTFSGDDRERPLTSAGRRRASSLVDLLEPFRPTRILSSPYRRCTETVRPLGDHLGLTVELTDDLAEDQGRRTLGLVERLARGSDGTALLCTHGDVALELLDHLIPGLDGPERGANRLQKGDVWVLDRAGGLSSGDTLRALDIVDHLRTDVYDVGR